jgi:hypothetical protein
LEQLRSPLFRIESRTDHLPAVTDVRAPQAWLSVQSWTLNDLEPAR